MSKFVDSVISFLGRRSSKDQAAEPAVAKRGRKAVLKADSFVFLPGECTSNGSYVWGEVITPRTVGVPPSSHSDDYSSLRRKNVQSVLIDGNSGKVLGRRLSGSFVRKAVKGHQNLDEVEDESLEAFLKEFEAEGEAEEQYHTYHHGDRRTEKAADDERYIYDRLIHLPLRSSGPPASQDRQRVGEEGERSRQTNNRVLDLRENGGRRRSSSGGSTEHYYAIPADQVARGERKEGAVDWEGLREQLKMAAVRGDDYAEVRDSDRQMLGHSLSPRDVTLEERIGEGQFGDVHKGLLYPGTKEEVSVAIKTCKPDASHEDRVKFLEEAAVMRKFDHAHIIKLFGVVSNEKQTYIVMELAPLGQLRRYLLTEGTRIPKLLLLQFIHQLSSAMVHLEAKGYVHRDIAARNVLVTTPEVVKLADFGLSRGLQDGNYYVASRGKLPIKWMAPESINFRRFTGLSDVWMFGVCCWEIMMRGVKPFVGIKNDEVISKIEVGERLPLPAEAPAPLFGLMNRCWSYDPEQRPDFRLVEATVAELLEEERQLATMTSRRLVPDIAPQKPPYRPHSSQGFMQVKRFSGVSDDDSVQQRMSGNLDDTLLGPALPPRISTRFRELSPSPSPHLFHRDNAPPSPHSNGSETPPLKPPRRLASPEDREREPSVEQAEPVRSRGNHTHAPIIPYSVTTLTSVDSSHQAISETRRSESPHHPIGMATIPPPAILQRSNEASQPSPAPSPVVYYSIPEDGGRSLGDDGQFGPSRTGGRSLGEDWQFGPARTGGRSLGEDGQFGPSRTGGRSLGDDGQFGPSGSDGRGSVAESESSHEGDETGEGGTGEEEEEVLGKVTEVVRAVMELSNRVSLSPPDQYIELVKGVGMAMRELLHTVDGVRQQLPQSSHHEMDMAQKVLSADFNNLIKAMKDAQKHHSTFLETEYQREMLKAAHVVAKNSKLLFDAVVSSIRRVSHRQR